MISCLDYIGIFSLKTLTFFWLLMYKKKNTDSINWWRYNNIARIMFFFMYFNFSSLISRYHFFMSKFFDMASFDGFFVFHGITVDEECRETTFIEKINCKFVAV